MAGVIDTARCCLTERSSAIVKRDRNRERHKVGVSSLAAFVSIGCIADCHSGYALRPLTATALHRFDDTLHRWIGSFIHNSRSVQLFGEV
ncbi:hypothetical protein NOVOSPHI9U_150018 [Novosphingobium sp. 9U]|nr:hypothetical protein NOVOSPHI9U_150018 [Novosphingobium sp. 9U]